MQGNRRAVSPRTEALNSTHAGIFKDVGNTIPDLPSNSGSFFVDATANVPQVVTRVPDRSGKSRGWDPQPYPEAYLQPPLDRDGRAVAPPPSSPKGDIFGFENGAPEERISGPPKLGLQAQMEMLATAGSTADGSVHAAMNGYSYQDWQVKQAEGGDTAHHVTYKAASPRPTRTTDDRSAAVRGPPRAAGGRPPRPGTAHSAAAAPPTMLEPKHELKHSRFGANLPRRATLLNPSAVCAALARGRIRVLAAAKGAAMAEVCGWEPERGPKDAAARSKRLEGAGRRPGLATNQGVAVVMAPWEVMQVIHEQQLCLGPVQAVDRTEEKVAGWGKYPRALEVSGGLCNTRTAPHAQTHAHARTHTHTHTHTRAQPRPRTHPHRYPSQQFMTTAVLLPLCEAVPDWEGLDAAAAEAGSALADAAAAAARDGRGDGAAADATSDPAAIGGGVGHLDNPHSAAAAAAAHARLVGLITARGNAKLFPLKGVAAALRGVLQWVLESVPAHKVVKDLQLELLKRLSGPEAVWRQYADIRRAFEWNLADWGTARVCEYVEMLGLDPTPFAEKQVTGVVLRHVTQAQLYEVLGVKESLLRQRLLLHVALLRHLMKWTAAYGTKLASALSRTNEKREEAAGERRQVARHRDKREREAALRERRALRRPSFGL
jgi:hypothetical protein